MKASKPGSAPSGLLSPKHRQRNTNVNSRVSSAMMNTSMENWRCGTQRLMQGYFSELVKVVLEHLDPCNPDEKIYGSSAGVGARSVMEKLRQEHEDNLKLGVNAADIEVAEIALLQQLWAHRRLQRNVQRTLAPDDEMAIEEYAKTKSHHGASTASGIENKSLAAGKDASLSHAPFFAVAGTEARDDPAPSDLACSGEGSSLPNTPSRPQSAQKYTIPEDLLDLFRIAQALRSVSSGAAKPSLRASLPTEEAGGVEKPLDIPADGPLPRRVVLDDDEDAEATEMARLCFHYLYNPSPINASPAPTSTRSPSPRPRSAKLPQPPNVQQKMTATSTGTQPSRPRQTTPLLRPSSSPAAQSLDASDCSDPLSTVSLSSPEAWRRLITGCDTSYHAQQPHRVEGDLPSPPPMRSQIPADTAPTAHDTEEMRKTRQGSGNKKRIAVPKPPYEPLPHTTKCLPEAGAFSDTEEVRLPLLQTSTSPVKHKNDVKQVKMKVRAGSHPRELRLLNDSVVLPPNYSGEHGERLTIAQLESLAASVSRDSAAADADVKLQYTAADMAAAELHRLQQAVAEVLFENVQLENDIATLTAKSDAGAESSGKVNADGSDLDTPAFLWGRERGQGYRANLLGNRHRGTAQCGARPGAIPYTSHSSLSSVCADAGMRQLVLPPVPVPLSHAKRKPTTVSLLLRRTGEKRALAPTSAAAVGAAQSQPCRREHAMRTSLKPHQNIPCEENPRTILHELRAAISSRQAETKQMLAEIDATKSRIAQHDVLMNGVAEYWRRNAAVMKRQHFAVRSHPKHPTSSDNTSRLGHDGEGWIPESLGGGTASSLLLRAASPEGKDTASTGSNYTPPSPVGRKHSHSVTAIGVASLPGHMANLDGSQSQLQRALAQMEAISPTQLSSSPSFDLRMASPPTGEHSSPASMGILWPRQLIPPQRTPEKDPVAYMADAMNPNTGAATEALVDADNTPVRPRAGVCVTPWRENGGDSVDAGRIPATPPYHSRDNTAYLSQNHPSGSTRREEENVLDCGSWCTIPALHLENVDEIAEFIYSVFERA